MGNPQPTASFVAQGNQLFMVDPTQSGVVQSVVALNGFQGLGGVKSSIKLTNFDSNGYDEFAPGLVDPGKPSGTVILNYGDASHQLCQKLLGMGNAGNTSFFFAQSDGLGSLAVPTAPSNVLTLPTGALTVAPAAPAAVGSSTGGTLPSATYYYVITAINAVGESTGTAEFNSGAVTGPTGSVALNWTASAGATGYKIYRSTATGAGSKQFLTQVGAVTAFSDTGAIAPSGATGAVPTSNTTNGYARSGWQFNGFISEFAFQTQVNNVAMCKLSIQATGARYMVNRGANTLI